MSLALRLFQLELLKALTYRVDFFTRIIGKALTISLTAWFLWRSIFAARGIDTLQGITLPELSIYYLALPLTLSWVMASDFDSISTDIYEGSLARQLIYPRSFLWMTFLRRYASALVSGLPYVLIGAIAWLIFPEQASVSLQPGNLLLFGALCALSAPAYFLLASTFDILAFWFEQTWSLRAMVRFVVLFLGGGYMPQEMLPEAMRAWTRWLPFEAMVALPTTLIARGTLPDGALSHALSVLAGWTLIFGMVFHWTWKRGLRQFAGSGM